MTDADDFDAQTRAGLGKTARTALEPPGEHDAGCWFTFRLDPGTPPGGTWVHCQQRPQSGKRTCHWHRHLEDGGDG